MTKPFSNRLKTIATMIVLTIALGGCSLLQQPGGDYHMPKMKIQVRNEAFSKPPYVEVERNPIPDHAWLRERASECESWQLGNNGCTYKSE